MLQKKTDFNPAQSLLIARGQYYKILHNDNGTVAGSYLVTRELYETPDNRYFLRDTAKTGNKGTVVVERLTPSQLADVQTKLAAYAKKNKTDYYELQTIA